MVELKKMGYFNAETFFVNLMTENVSMGCVLIYSNEEAVINSNREG